MVILRSSVPVPVPPASFTCTMYPEYAIVLHLAMYSTCFVGRPSPIPCQCLSPMGF
jgi:hypothetical protein